MKIYQLENGNIEVVTKIKKDGTREGFVIVMNEDGQAEYYCRTSCSKQVFEAFQELYSYEVEHG